jgi:hypothetical protein
MAVEPWDGESGDDRWGDDEPRTNGELEAGEGASQTTYRHPNLSRHTPGGHFPTYRTTTTLPPHQPS